MKIQLAFPVILSLFSALLVPVSPAAAEIYRWVDADGTVHYGDQPRGGAQPADLPDLYKADPVGTAAISSNRPTAEATVFDGMVQRLTITSPTNEQTFREADGQVTVQVAVEPGLPEKATLRYFMDGRPVTAEPTRSTSIRVESVPPGAHTVAASVVLNGSEVARAKPVVFYLQPPSTIKPLQTQSGTPSGNSASAPPATQSRGVLGAPRAGGAAGP